MTENRAMLKKINNGILPGILLLLAVVTCNQGVDVSDATYSLGNYMFLDNVYGTWALATYVSNFVGSVIVRLPYGNRLIAANFYTGLILGLIAVSIYLLLRKELGTSKVFLAEVIAVCFCWIPTTILYNYLSYLFMVLGCLLMYKGLLYKRDWLLLIAGLAFGINVFVRIPNLTQIAFILVVWMASLLEKEGIKKTIKKTVLCAVGYILSVLVCLVSVIYQYGINAITEMIVGLGDISSSDDTYSVVSMISDTFMAYIHSLKWTVVILSVFCLGLILFSIRKNQFIKAKTYIYTVIILLMFRLLWGRGMFSFRYYEDYSSIYEWGMAVLIISIMLDIYVLLRNTYENNLRYLACISLVTIIISPLGSNNYTFQNINNLFLVMPVTTYMFFDIFRKCRDKYYKNAVTMLWGAIALVILVQSVGFHACFSFRDGTRGEKRDTEIVGVDSLYGMYTNRERAKNLQEVCLFIKQEDISELIYWGDCPGLAYILRVPSAISTTWPDLDSFGVEDFRDEIDGCISPVIIRKKGLSGSNSVEKFNYLKQRMDMNNYECRFENEEYSVYIKTD